MRPRGLVFGIVFLLLGVLLVIGTAFDYGRRRKSDAKFAQEHPNEWHPFAEPSVIDEGAGWAGILSITSGFVLLAPETIKFMRRRQAQ
jgi:hypothetical protein